MPATSHLLRRCAAALTVVALAAGLVSCSDDEPVETEPDNADVTPSVTYDPATPIEAKFDVPEGFLEDTSQEVVSPLSDNYSARFFTMQGVETVEAVFVVSYVLDSDTTGMSTDNLIKVVNGFDQIVGNKDTGKAYVSLANGRVGVHKYVLQALEAGSGNNIRYNAEYFFEGTHLVQVGCQFDAESAAVTTACQTVLQNLSF